MWQREIENSFSPRFLTMSSEEHGCKSVKRKLFDDGDSVYPPPKVKQVRRLRSRRCRASSFRSVLCQDSSCLSDSDDWQSVADSQETFSEFDSNSNDSGFLLTPNRPQSENLIELRGDPNDNFTWLLNFKVESLFQTPWDHPVDHDHNYRSQLSFNCTQITIEKNALDNYQSEYEPINVRGVRKPPYTYTELIELALKDQGELTVSGIYKWIMEHFPFFKASDDRWKNSVRHNLSINANFKKGRKAQGSSHLWTIASASEKKLKQELLNQTNKAQWKKKFEELEQTFTSKTHYLQCDGESEKVYTLRQGNLKQAIRENTKPSCGINQNQVTNKSAEEILNGDLDKKVEVQLLTPLRPLAYTFLLESREFLNPVPQKEVVQESGLLEDNHAVHSLPQQIFNSICSEIEPSGDLFEDDFALSYLNISP